MGARNHSFLASNPLALRTFAVALMMVVALTVTVLNNSKADAYVLSDCRQASNNTVSYDRAGMGS